MRIPSDIVTITFGRHGEAAQKGGIGVEYTRWAKSGRCTLTYSNGMPGTYSRDMESRRRNTDMMLRRIHNSQVLTAELVLHDTYVVELLSSNTTQSISV